MIKDDGNGRLLMQQTVSGVVRRIPLTRNGISKRGVEWELGGVLIEASEQGFEGSVPLFFSTFDTELIELINRIGVGKEVVVTFHIECSAYYDNYRTNLVLDSIEGKNSSENFIYGITKKGDKQ
jgi:hypothetical protein